MKFDWFKLVKDSKKQKQVFPERNDGNAKVHYIDLQALNLNAAELTAALADLKTLCDELAEASEPGPNYEELDFIPSTTEPGKIIMDFDPDNYDAFLADVDALEQELKSKNADEKQDAKMSDAAHANPAAGAASAGQAFLLPARPALTAGVTTGAAGVAAVAAGSKERNPTQKLAALHLG